MSVARYHVGDALAVLEGLEPASVDLVFTSPPFFHQRAYLPDDDPAKPLELGDELTPGEFLDRLLEVTVALRRVLAPHGSIAVELGDTYSGSGGAGGDYNAGGLREGQPKYLPKAKAGRARYSTNGHPRAGERTRRDRSGWALDKSLCLVPELYRIALAYGTNPLTGVALERWRVRNVVRWVRANPSVGRDSDKFRPGTSDLVIACTRRDRYWDGDAVRVPAVARAQRRFADDHREVPGQPARQAARLETATAPLLDWWEVATATYGGEHYAVMPAELARRAILAMSPERVCRSCGQPSRRIVEAASLGKGTRRTRSGDGHRDWLPSSSVPPAAERRTVGWTDCGHDDWRRGVVLDPYAGTGTTLGVATGAGRDAIGIDLDARNAVLALERVGMFLEVLDPAADRA